VVLNPGKTAKIKTGLLILVALPNLFLPIGARPQQGILMSVLPGLLFGSFGIPLIVKFNYLASNANITEPRWGDNPLTFKRPLSFFQFGAFSFLLLGASILLGSAIKFHVLNGFGVSFMSFGAGILLGIRLALWWRKGKA
jgi:hypothetical protein